VAQGEEAAQNAGRAVNEDIEEDRKPNDALGALAKLSAGLEKKPENG
jgi:hypothetical protein